MYNHVIDFLEHNNILYDFQFGFRKHHSTNHAIITMVEKVVFPYMIYCTEIWGNSATIHLNLIIILQNKCIRVITFSHYLSPSKPLFDSVDILKL